MYVADRLVYTELHKTGGTHIGKWLDRLVPGEQRGKHNRVPAALRDRFLLGSIRDPWDWYVSLWAYGCLPRGSVAAQVTRRVNLRYLREQLPAEMGLGGFPVGTMLRQLAADVVKPVDRWRAAYRDSKDPAAFRSWLRLMMDPARRFDIAEGYGFSPVSAWAGVLTYRYLKLFTNLDDALYHDRRLGTFEGARRAWAESRTVGHVIRNEHLVEDLLEALTLAGYELNAEQRNALLASRDVRTNRSERLGTAHYYDAESVALVAGREALIIAEHGYTPPMPERA